MVLPESIPVIKQAAGTVSDEALAALDEFSKRFYQVCKEIAASAEEAQQR